MLSTCPRLCLPSVGLISTLGLVTLLSACQLDPQRNDLQEDIVVSKEEPTVHEPLAMKEHKDICVRPIATPPPKFSHLSPRQKKMHIIDYVTQIRSQITTNWTKPELTTQEESCTAIITQRVDGCVKKVEFDACANSQVQRTVHRAILRASPLPQAPHPAIFDTTIRMNFVVKR